jgi:hypothetical protein
VQLNRKTALPLSVVLGMALWGVGCSGINTSQSISPATFLIPGFFGQNPPPPPPGGVADTISDPAPALAPVH